MNDLTRKKKSRTALRNQCKKLEASIEDVLKNFNDNNLVELKGLKLNYENQMSRIDAVDQEILNLITEEEQLKVELENSLLEKHIFYGVLSNVDHRISEFKPDVKISPGESPHREKPLLLT